MSVPGSEASKEIELVLHVDGIAYRWDPCVFHDLAHPVTFTDADPTAFGLPTPRAAPLAATVRAATVHDLNPHTATHIEGIGHIEHSGPSIGGLLEKSLFPATLVTIVPERGADGDARVRRAPLAAALGPFDPFQEAVLVRSLDEGASRTRFTGTNPPYFASDAAAFLSGRGTRLLVVDLPSLDREQDGGCLAAHRAFLTDAATPRAVVELARIPPEASDGSYLLEIVALRWELDASPVRPLLYPVTR